MIQKFWHKVMSMMLLGGMILSLVAPVATLAAPQPEAEAAIDSRAPSAEGFQREEPGSNCSLLDDPAVRKLMSGAFETMLLYDCGRQNELGQVASPQPWAPSDLGLDVLVNNPTGEVHPSATQSETSLARNEDSSVICSAYNDAYSGVMLGTGFTGYSASYDQGATWIDYGDIYDMAGPLSRGDPSNVWSKRDNKFYHASLSAGGNLGIWDLGADCDQSVWIGNIHVGGGDDKELMAVDNNPTSLYYGRLYVAWTDFNIGPEFITTSDDGGVTWSVPVNISGANGRQGAWPAVDPINGDVYVSWLDRSLAATHSIEVVRSTDGGATWAYVTDPITNYITPRDNAATTACGRQALNGNIRYLDSGQIFVDRNQNLHVVYSYDPDGNGVGDVINVYYRRSTDQGATWEPEIQLNDDATPNDQFFPAVTVNDAGVVGAFWYDRRLDLGGNLLFDYYKAVSLDNGLTFQPNIRVSDVSSPVVLDPNLATCYHGDYDTSVSDLSRFYIQWSDDRRGDPDIWSDTELILTDLGWLAGEVTDSGTSAPIAGATVEAVGTYTFMDTTSASGVYSITLSEDIYNVTASAYGYLPEMVPGVSVISGTTTIQDFSLNPAPTYVVDGTVTDANTGWPLYASIDIDGYPGPPIWTNPLTGYYSISLATGTAYTFNVDAFVPGYIGESRGVGPLVGDVTENFGLNADPTTCDAPGYSPPTTFLSEGFEGAFPPAGWSAYDLDGGVPQWVPVADRVHSGVQSATHTWHPGVYQDGWLVTPQVSLGAVPTLSFWENEDWSGYYVKHSLWVCTSGCGAPPTNYVEVDEYSAPQEDTWAQRTTDLSAYAGQNVYLAFRYEGLDADTWWLDDVTVFGCSLQPGGLVVGNVYDHNTMAPLTGAQVSNEDGFTITTVDTPADPAVDDGFYTIFSPAFLKAHDASKAHYVTDTAALYVNPGTTILQNFHLPAGLLDTTPDSMHVTIDMGLSTTLPLDLDNLGTWAADFELKETDVGFIQARVDSGKPLLPHPNWPLYEPMSMPYWDESEKAPDGAEPLAPLTWGTGAPIPTGARYRAAGTTCDGQTYYIFGGWVGAGVTDESWQYDPTSDTWTALASMPVALANMEATCLDGLIYLVGGYTGSLHTNNFQIYDVAADTWFLTTWAKIGTPMTAAYGGKLYAMGGNPAASSDVFVYDPGTGVWTPLTSMPTGATYGAAVTVGDYIYQVGGSAGISALNVVQRYDPASDTWDNSGPQLQTARMSALTVWYGDYLYAVSGGNLWTVINTTEVYDPSLWPGGAWAYDDENVPIPLVAMAGDCATDMIWGAGGTSGAESDANQWLDDGLACNVAIDVPWLSEEPITGTVAGGGLFKPTLANPDVKLPSGQKVEAPPEGLAVSAEISREAAPAAPQAPEAVLWNQPTRNSGGASQYFPDFTAGIYSADDFTLGVPWAIDTIHVDGFSSLGYGTLNNAQALYWVIYRDAGGMPQGAFPGDGSGVEVWAYASAPGTPGVTIGASGVQDDVDLDLVAATGSPLYLAPGHYWLSFFPSMDFTLFNQWYWDVATTANLNPVMMTDPYGLLGPPFPWTPWLAIFDPTAFDAAFRLDGNVVAPGQVIDVTFDASVPEVDQPGDYLAELRVINNTPYGPPTVPVSMTVNPPADWGKLLGTIEGLGYCDEDPGPLEGAEVFIEASDGMTWTLNTDANGYYQRWLDVDGNTYTVTVTAADHEVGMGQINLAALQDNTLDFDLRWLVPCVGPNPVALDVEVVHGFTETVPLTVINDGAMGTDFEFVELEGGFTSALRAPLYEPPASQGTGANLLQHALANVERESQTVESSAPTQDLLLDQQPNQSNGIFSDANCDACGSLVQTIADNFVLGNLEVIDQIILWSGYWPGNVPIDPDHITVIFHDDAAGLPGAAIYTEADVAYARVQTGVTLFGVDEWMHTLTLGTPVALGPGNYWVEIYNDTGLGTDDFFWEVGDADTVGNGLPGSAFSFTAPGSAWNFDGINDFAIQIVGVPPDVPWLSEDPVTGTLSADDVAPVDVGFDASVPEVDQLGTYTATLRIRSDDPINPVYDIPVTMQVIAPEYGVSIEPDGALSGDPGETLTYTLTVTNTSNAPTDSFNITVGSSTWATAVDQGVVGPLAVGASATVKATVTIAADAAGGAMDVVQITATSQGDVTKTDIATLTTTANNIYGVIVDPPTASLTGYVGQTVSYTLMVSNTGNTMDTYDMAASGYTWPMSLPPSMGPMNAGESHPMQVVVTIPSTATHGMTDTATVTLTSQGDGSKTDSVTLTTMAVETKPTDADLAVIKSASPDPVAMGGNLVYTLVVTNNGPADATNVVLVDNLPSGVTYVSADHAGCVHAAGTVTCNLGDMTNGSSLTVKITVTVDVTGTLTNTASVSADENDPITGNDSVTISTDASVPKIYLPIVHK